jgi:hypothetical protein
MTRGSLKYAVVGVRYAWGARYARGGLDMARGSYIYAGGRGGDFDMCGAAQYSRRGDPYVQESR